MGFNKNMIDRKIAIRTDIAPRNRMVLCKTDIIKGYQEMSDISLKGYQILKVRNVENQSI